MRLNDVNKLKGMVLTGVSEADIIKSLHQYPEEEIRKFLPSEPVKKVTKKKAVKKAPVVEEPSDSFLD